MSWSCSPYNPPCQNWQSLLVPMFPSRSPQPHSRFRRISEGSHDSGREGHCLPRDLMVYVKTFTPVSLSTITHVTHSVTHSLTHSFTHAPTHSLTHSHTYTFTPSSVSQSVGHWLTHSLIDSHTYSLSHTHSLTPPRRTMRAVESTGALLHWHRVSREPTRYVTPYTHFNITICNDHTCIRSKLSKFEDMTMSEAQKCVGGFGEGG